METLPLDIRTDIYKRACLMEMGEKARPFTDVYYTFLFMDGSIIVEKESVIRKFPKEFLVRLNDKVNYISDRVIDSAIEDASHDEDYVQLDPYEDDELMDDIIEDYLENYKNELKIEFYVRAVNTGVLLDYRETHIDTDESRPLDAVLRDLMA